MKTNYIIDSNCLKSIQIEIDNTDDISDKTLTINIPNKILSQEILKIGNETDKFINITSSDEFEIKNIIINISDGIQEIIRLDLRPYLTAYLKINIPKSIKIIGPNCFMGCKFESITFDKDSQISKIEEKCFSLCEFNEPFILPDNCKVIGRNAFFTTIFNKGIVFNENSKLETIDTHAFVNSTLNVDNLTFPKQILKIGYESFYNCKNLKNIFFPKSSNIKLINEGAFSHSSVREVTIKNKLNNLCFKKSCFSFCKNLKLLDLSEAFISEIPPKFCEYSSQLEKIFFPETLTSIEASAFSQCNLSSIILHHNIKHIGNYAFSQNRINKIEFEASINISYIGTHAFSDNKLSTLHDDVFQNILFCGDNAFANNSFSFLVLNSPNDKAQFGTNIFANNINLYNVCLINKKTKWKELFPGMFKDCKNLEICVLPQDTIETICSRCFMNTNLHKFQLDSVKKIGLEAFCDCKNLTKCSFKNLIRIKDNAFKNTSINEIKLDSFSTISISRKAFSSFSDEQIYKIFSSSPFIKIK